MMMLTNPASAGFFSHQAKSIRERARSHAARVGRRRFYMPKSPPAQAILHRVAKRRFSLSSRRARRFGSQSANCLWRPRTSPLDLKAQGAQEYLRLRIGHVSQGSRCSATIAPRAGSGAVLRCANSALLRTGIWSWIIGGNRRRGRLTSRDCARTRRPSNSSTLPGSSAAQSVAPGSQRPYCFVADRLLRLRGRAPDGRTNAPQNSSLSRS
jgi:hypothetical protein